ncbi:ATP-binding protein [Deinococcus marmoris]|uniref:ATP-binding protein n=1 Tax=Deinococcus marmoris TaxID=249408 RepID=UPI0005566041|nr:ATP-binding protein [Deinococcus marmoris]
MDVPLTVLGQRLRALTARRVGLAAYLWGEAGIGKSYTNRALLQETPYRSVTLAARLPLPELIRALPRPVRLRDWTRAALEGLELGRAVTMPAADILAALLGQLAPFVLCLEDLHEADDARIQLNAQLAAAVARTRGAALLVSSRLPPPEDWPDGALVLALERLSPQASAAMLTAEAGAELPAGALAWMDERARGNPLFTLEYFRLLARQGHLWNSGDRWRWRVPQGESLPGTVEAVIGRSLQDAGEAPLEAMLDALALLPGAGEPLLADCAGLSVTEAVQALRQLERLGIVTGGQFVHPLYREVFRQGRSAGQRLAAARRAVRALEGQPGHAAAFAEEAQLPAEQALALYAHAADAATGPGEVARFQALAARHAAGEERARLALTAASVLQNSDLGEAGRLCDLALAASPDDPAVRLRAAELQAQRGLLDPALALLDSFAGQPEAWQHQLSVRLLGGDTAGALALWREHPTAQEGSSVKLISRVVGALVLGGQPAEAQVLAGATLSRAVTPEERAALLNSLANAHYYQGQLTQAHEVWAELIALSQQHGFRRQRAAALVNRSQARLRAGEADAARPDIEEAAGELLAVGDLRAYAHSLVMLGDLLIHQTHFEQAEERLQEAVSVLDAQLSPILVNAELALGSLYAEWPTPHAPYLALRHSRNAATLAKQLGNPPLRSTSLALLSQAEGLNAQPDAALATADEALALAETLPQPLLRVSALNSRGLALRALERREEAASAFQTALEAASAAEFHEAAWQCRLELARERHDPDAARACLDWFTAQHLPLNMAAVTRAFPELRPERAQGSAVAQTDASPLVLRLEVLGEMRFGPPGASSAVRGRKRRELLACLLDSRLRGRPDAARLTLTDALYPGTEESQAASALKELVHQTRAALGTGVIQTTERGYALGEVQSDAELFLQAGDTALWHGPYLAGEEAEPGGPMADTLYGALLARAGALCTEHPAEAARVGRLLCGASPYDRATLALTLRALRAAGNHRSLGRFYAAARQGFAELGEALPEDWAAFLETHFLETQGAQANAPA